jgi:hypothetical protein
MMSRWITRTFNPPEEELPNCAACYAIYCDGELVYIGQTIELRKRIFTSHGIGWSMFSNWTITPWGRFRKFKIKYRPSVKQGDWLMVEQRLIHRLKPRFNRRGVGKRRIAYA